MAASKFNYPVARRDETVEEDYNGVKIKDPYRWLEDPDSKETVEWVDQQCKITASVLSQCGNRQEIFQRIKEMQNYPKYGVPSRRGPRYFFWMNEGLQNQHVLYVQDSLTDSPRVFLDPNKLSADGTVSIGVTRFTESGSLFAYSVHASGSDWQVIRFKDVKTGEVLPDELHWVKFSGIAWSYDEKGIFYSRYPTPKTFTNEEVANSKSKGTETEAVKNHKLYYHKLGTKQEDDVLVYSVPEGSTWLLSADVTEDGEYLIITTHPSCERVNSFYYVKLNTQSTLEHLPIDQATGMVSPVKLIDDFTAEYDYVANDGPLFYLKTNKDAPKNKLIKMNLNDAHDVVEVIPEKPEPLQWVACINDNLVVAYMEHVKEIMYLYSMEGVNKYTFPLPTLGSISGFSGKRKDTELFYNFVSFAHAGTIYRYDFKNGETSIFRQTEVKGLDPFEFDTQQVFYESHDKTKIPMFIVKKKSVPLTSETPVLLYGYGGFNISITPSFSVSRIVWMKHFNAVLVIANIRGGDEYGEEWHKAGILDKKQNGFEDFKHAAKTLYERGWSSPNKLAIMGGSNGGLLVGACITQSPELFGAGVAQVPVIDMLRFHKFTIGSAWTSDYGCADIPEQFQYLIKYSPLHNVKKGNPFPALMITTGDHDDRVVPLHSFKFAAELQHQLGNEDYQKQPLFVRIDRKAGHGAGKPMDKVIEEAADTYSFLAHFLGATYHP